MTVKAITFGDVLRFSLLPGIVPRARGLFGTGFASLALFIALVYRAVRLLPEGHPYLNPAFAGRFGVLDVIGAAYAHVRQNRFVLGRNNLDQMVVFFTILAALILLAFQFAMLAFALVIPQAAALPFGFTNPMSFFAEPSLALNGHSQNFYDISFIFLDRVFGVPGVFNSCIADGVANSCVAFGPNGNGAGGGVPVNDPGQFPSPFHAALHGVFQFYSVALSVVAAFLLIYYTIVVVAETAQTGTPFGKRFNTVWAPIRLVVALGLLLPMGYGLNAAQYIVLYAAKYGGNFASNGWIEFNKSIVNGTIAGAQADLVAGPKTPDINQLFHFFSVAHACRVMEEKVLYPRSTDSEDPDFNKPPILAGYIVKSPSLTSPLTYKDFVGTSYDDAVAWSNYGDITIRFGVHDPVKYPNQRGFVLPSCGEIVIKTIAMPVDTGKSVNVVDGSGNVVSSYKPSFYYKGAYLVQKAYYDLVKELWIRNDVGEFYSCPSFGAVTLNDTMASKIALPYVSNYFSPLLDNPKLTLPDSNYRTDAWSFSNQCMKAIVDNAVSAQRAEVSAFAHSASMFIRGWGEAGIWYNRIADMNGALSTSVWNVPTISHYPMTMEKLAQEKRKVEANTKPSDIFDPSSAKVLRLDRPDEFSAADTYWQITKFWQGADGGMSTSTRATRSGNIIIDVIGFFFGTDTLFSIRDNADVHPLAQLSALGKTLIERSMTMLAVGLAATGIEQLFPEVKNVAGIISTFTFSILSIGITAGFVLYYVIPFLPFIYFFFAVGGWVKAIFEAMVGVPLWALAHLRIDGNGLPGDAAINGYYLIFEIFLRPILIVFGLIASVSIFAASVHVLNDVFDLAVSNVSGFDPQNPPDNMRGAVDTLFFTIMYVILVYMLGQSSFKLIDLIPGSMLRWMGSGASPFQDSGAEAASSLVSYGTMGGNMVFGQVAGAVKGGVQGIAGTARAIGEQMKK